MDRRTFIKGVAGTVALAQHVRAAELDPGDASRSSLDTLAQNQARTLGSYANPELPGSHHITDYSGMTLDPDGHRMLIFGGGHGPSNGTDIRAFDLRSLRWSSLYASTPLGDMRPGNCDTDRGCWRSTGHPTARHTYNLTLVRDRRFHVLTSKGMPYVLEQGVAEPLWGGRLCTYDFDAQRWSYSRYHQTAQPSVPWVFTSAAVLDPVSKAILVVGYRADYDAGHVWHYDPVGDLITEIASHGPDVGAEHDIVHVGATDRFYVLQSDGRVWELMFDRSNPRASAVRPLEVSGERPGAPMGTVCAYAYDTVNEVIGGSIRDGVYYAFDPAQRAWTASRIEVERGTTGVPGQCFHCLEFDPVSGCFIFLDAAATHMTWAYRPPRRRAPRSAARGRSAVDDGARV